MNNYGRRDAESFISELEWWLKNRRRHSIGGRRTLRTVARAAGPVARHQGLFNQVPRSVDAQFDRYSVLGPLRKPNRQMNLG